MRRSPIDAATVARHIRRGHPLLTLGILPSDPRAIEARRIVSEERLEAFVDEAVREMRCEDRPLTHRMIFT